MRSMIKWFFAVDWLYELALLIWPTLRGTVEHMPTPERLTALLREQCAILVPYDCDKNNEPIIRDGNTAHWCIVVSSYHYVLLSFDSFLLIFFPSYRGDLCWNRSNKLCGCLQQLIIQMRKDFDSKLLLLLRELVCKLIMKLSKKQIDSYI